MLGVQTGLLLTLDLMLPLEASGSLEEALVVFGYGDGRGQRRLFGLFGYLRWSRVDAK